MIAYMIREINNQMSWHHCSRNRPIAAKPPVLAIIEESPVLRANF
jgi:hypothetical protein